MRHFLNPLDFSIEELDTLMDLADDIRRHPDKYAHACAGKKLATLFYEPSTRTRLSFEAAMLNLGGSVLGFSSADSSSARQRRNAWQTPSAWFPAMRTSAPCAIPRKAPPRLPPCIPPSPSSMRGTAAISTPPRQLTDLLTIRSLKGQPGSSDRGSVRRPEIRTDGSLSHRAPCPGMPASASCSSPRKSCAFPITSARMFWSKDHIPYQEVIRLEDALPDLDVLYMTRVQKERFFNEEDYVRMKDFYILDREKMKLAPQDMIVLHPLPRVNEIAAEVDDDPRAAYFKQVQYGVYVRMALILTLLEVHVC